MKKAILGLMMACTFISCAGKGTVVPKPVSAPPPEEIQVAKADEEKTAAYKRLIAETKEAIKKQRTEEKEFTIKYIKSYADYDAKQKFRETVVATAEETAGQFSPFEKHNGFLSTTFEQVGIPLDEITVDAVSGEKVKPGDVVYVDPSAVFSLPIKEKYVVTCGYGPRTHPVTGEKRSPHNALDIAAYGKLGVDIRAITSGEVIFAGNTRKYDGYQVVIDHGNGYTSSYSHVNKNLLVEKGDFVTPGQPIAKQGNTGRSTGEHLHFVMKKDGKIIDPEPILAYIKQNKELIGFVKGKEKDGCLLLILPGQEKGKELARAHVLAVAYLGENITLSRKNVGAITLAQAETSQGQVSELSGEQLAAIEAVHNQVMREHRNLINGRN